MRVRNTRLIAVGTIMILGALAFFLYFMVVMAAKSNDPKAMMEAVGQASGVVGGIGVAMTIIGLIGKKV